MFTEMPATRASYAQRTKVYGMGINDAPYKTNYKLHGITYRCPYYAVWYGVMERCFSKKFHTSHPTYTDCTVHTPWLLFSNFRSWMEQQDWKGKHLDKDILVKGNKHYSPDTCIFISPALNNLLCKRENDRGEYPLGVSKMTVKGHVYFVASCSLDGKQKRLGYFKTPEEAALQYEQAKRLYILTLAEREKDNRVKAALLRQAI